MFQNHNSQSRFVSQKWSNNNFTAIECCKVLSIQELVEAQIKPELIVVTINLIELIVVTIYLIELIVTMMIRSQVSQNFKIVLANQVF